VLKTFYVILIGRSGLILNMEWVKLFWYFI